MKLNEALAKMIVAGSDAKVSRAGGPTLRRSASAEERARHVYCTDAGGEFLATAEDIDATDWEVVGGRPPPPAPKPASKPEPEPKK